MSKSKQKQASDQRREEYEAYIHSDEWKAFRLKIFAVRGRQCEDCGKASGQIHVHHLHYRNFMHELPEDVKVLCEACHMALHPEHAKAKGLAPKQPTGNLGNGECGKCRGERNQRRGLCKSCRKIRRKKKFHERKAARQTRMDVAIAGGMSIADYRRKWKLCEDCGKRKKGVVKDGICVKCAARRLSFAGWFNRSLAKDDRAL